MQQAETEDNENIRFTATMKISETGFHGLKIRVSAVRFRPWPSSESMCYGHR